MNVDLETRVFPEEGAGGTRVVEVNVGEEDSGQIGELESLKCQLVTQGGEGGCRAGIDKGNGIFSTQKRRGNRARMASPIQVEGDGRVHERRVVYPKPVTAVAGKGSTLGRGRNRRAREAGRNHLQNDEVMEYAFKRSDLFHMCLALSEVVRQACGAAQIQGNKQNAGSPPQCTSGSAGDAPGLKRRAGFIRRF